MDKLAQIERKSLEKRVVAAKTTKVFSELKAQLDEANKDRKAQDAKKVRQHKHEIRKAQAQSELEGKRNAVK